MPLAIYNLIIGIANKGRYAKRNTDLAGILLAHRITYFKRIMVDKQLYFLNVSLIMKVNVNVIRKINVNFVLYVKYLCFIKTSKLPKLKSGKRKTQIFLYINI